MHRVDKDKSQNTEYWGDFGKYFSRSERKHLKGFFLLKKENTKSKNCQRVFIYLGVVTKIKEKNCKKTSTFKVLFGCIFKCTLLTKIQNL